MKRKDAQSSSGLPAPTPAGGESLDRLLEALLAMRTPGELRALLEDLCTPAELEAIADRWRVVPLLIGQVPYREIHERTGVSVTTVGRIARCLGLGSGGYRLAAERVLAGADPLPH
jgi:TrpR-related protein YerC/YecD